MTKRTAIKAIDELSVATAKLSFLLEVTPEAAFGSNMLTISEHAAVGLSLIIEDINAKINGVIQHLDEVSDQ